MTVQTNLSHNPRLMRFPEVKAVTGLCRSHIHALIAKGEFPSQIKISVRASAWVSDEIHEWIEKRISASRPINEQGDAK